MICLNVSNSIFFAHAFTDCSFAVPNLQCVVHTSCDESLPAAIQIKRSHEVIMHVLKLAVAAPIAQVPNPQALVIARADQPLTTRVENQIVHPVVMANQSY